MDSFHEKSQAAPKMSERQGIWENKKIVVNNGMKKLGIWSKRGGKNMASLTGQIILSRNTGEPICAVKWKTVIR